MKFSIKYIIFIFLILLSIFSFTACKNENKKNNLENKKIVFTNENEILKGKINIIGVSNVAEAIKMCINQAH